MREVEEAEEVITAVQLGANDPLAGAQVFLAIREAGACLVVDPWCRAAQLLDLLRHTEATRLLRGTQPKDDLGIVLRGAPRAFEAREHGRP